MKQDILSSLQLHKPAVLTSSFNRPNIHYTILLLDVQQAPGSTSAAASGNASAFGGKAAACGVVGNDDGADDADDRDHAGYAHLLQLLKPAARQRAMAAAAPATAAAPAAAAPGQQSGLASASAGQPVRQQQQQQWPGPISIVYCLKR